MACFDLDSGKKFNKCTEIIKIYDFNQLVEKYLQIEQEYLSIINQIEMPMTNIHQEFLKETFGKFTKKSEEYSEMLSKQPNLFTFHIH